MSSSTPSLSDDIPKSTKASSTASEDKEENLQVFAKLVVKISSAEASTEFLTASLGLDYRLRRPATLHVAAMTEKSLKSIADKRT